jgi:DNA-binding IscR family transcriptional regulator
MGHSAAEISLLHVVEAVQGPIALNVCTIDPDECPLAPECPMVESWVRMQETLVRQLRQETLEKLVQRGGALADL